MGQGLVWGAGGLGFPLTPQEGAGGADTSRLRRPLAFAAGRQVWLRGAPPRPQCLSGKLERPRGGGHGALSGLGRRDPAPGGCPGRGEPRERWRLRASPCPQPGPSEGTGVRGPPQRPEAGGGERRVGPLFGHPPHPGSCGSPPRPALFACLSERDFLIALHWLQVESWAGTEPRTAGQISCKPLIDFHPPTFTPPPLPPPPGCPGSLPARHM